MADETSSFKAKTIHVCASGSESDYVIGTSLDGRIFYSGVSVIINGRHHRMEFSISSPVYMQVPTGIRASYAVGKVIAGFLHIASICYNILHIDGPSTIYEGMASGSAMTDTTVSCSANELSMGFSSTN